MPKIRTVAIAASVVLLLLAIGVQWKASGRVDHSQKPVLSLADALPATIAGGMVRDEPIANTEEMKKSVGELLNYDDAVFRIYQVGSRRISVYIAYWKPGKMSPRLVASHTPDVCWLGNGWTRDTFAEGQHAELRHLLATTDFLNGETRVFTAHGRPEYVVFWHKVGETIQNYGTDYAPPWWAMLAELWRNGLSLRQEQLFVRVSSDVPLEQVFQTRQFEPLRSALLKLGLRRSVQ